MAAYLGTYVSRVDDGGLEFRGDRGTLKIDRTRLAFYRDDAAVRAGTLTPEPEICRPLERRRHRWRTCRTGSTASAAARRPNADIRDRRTTPRARRHIANAALRAGRRVRWNGATERVETD